MDQNLILAVSTICSNKQRLSKDIAHKASVGDFRNQQKKKEEAIFKYFLFFIEVANVSYSDRLVLIKHSKNPWKNLKEVIF